MFKQIGQLFFPLFLLLALVLCYWNHFNNSFHFDDSHSIESNLFLRDIGNIPRFFLDATTFSVLPSNQAYRPVLTATLAFDYWLGGGLEPFYFHLSSFLLFILQLALMYPLFLWVMNTTGATNRNSLWAFFAVAWYGFHPVNAETVNYLIQRGDILSTLAVVAAFVLYLHVPGARRFGLYLIPIVIGSLAKPPSIMFAPLLLGYTLLFESRTGFCLYMNAERWRAIRVALLHSLPAWLLCILLYLLQTYMTPAGASSGGSSFFRYVLIQPFVTLYYFKNLFLPTALSVDTDWELAKGIGDVRIYLGLAFYLFICVSIVYTSLRPRLRPISFGLYWFLIALVPTSVIPLAEVMNDHRMFFPFVGLTLACVWSFKCLLEGFFKHAPHLMEVVTKVSISTCYCLLPVYALATVERNRVWHNEESLWRDAIQKSPQNGRALMNYGLTQMEKGRNAVALQYFLRAQKLVPYYYILEINLGIVQGELRNITEAEKHFQKAIQLGQYFSAPYFYYARWLNGQGRTAESILNLKHAIARVPSDFDARHLLMSIYVKEKEWSNLKNLSLESLQIVPGDTLSALFLKTSEANEQSVVVSASQAARENSTPEQLLELSFTFYKASKFQECIETAEKALIMRADYPEAWNNIGSAHSAMGRWEEAIRALERALQLKPEFQLAKNNLAWAKAQLKQQKGE